MCLAANSSAQTKGEHRRARLLSTLDELLLERPLADISISDVTSRSGVTRSGFYFYFPTKEAAVAALLEELLDEILVQGDPFFEGQPDQRAALTNAILALHDVFHAHRHIVLAIMDARAADQSARHLWDGWLEGFVARLSDRIARDRSVDPRPGSRPEDLARVLIWATEAVLERDLRRFQYAGHQDRGWVEALVDMWLTTIY